tara:strand:- start:105 stop:518 length:414 start_codon:yes stop_codon:yes gene_type:complete
MSWFTKTLSLVVSPITKAYETNQQRKQARETADAKIKFAKQDNDYKLDLNEQEWEALSKKSEDGTWKDEYVTIIITSPFVLLFIASVVSGFTGDMKYLDSVNLGIENIKSLGVDLGELMYVVVLAAVSIKGVNIFRR